MSRFIPAYAGNARSSSSPRYRTTVHPRIRGERELIAGYRRGRSRFIPAYAGNAMVKPLPVAGKPVHPRIRGERRFVEKPPIIRSGSSPHTRGTRDEIRSAVHFQSVHPRIRGERLKFGLFPNAGRGSSPHTRGTLVACRLGAAEPRFIPAYAGNAPAGCDRWSGPAVHPRIRGERTLPRVKNGTTGGSSPHTRGTLRFRQPHACRQRFIPAYAGNASGCPSPACPRPVHPRIRGERYTSRHPFRVTTGSSPHTRGTRHKVHCVAGKVRFIPAYAGNAHTA